ncbi:MAG TPA: hypothetical protein VGO62_06310 [Myxococcota bacterium]|jgi:hypothetical protein
MLTLQEKYRQLALDLGAVTVDDPELDDFRYARAGVEVQVEFEDYKKELTIEARPRGSNKRPSFAIARRGPIDRMGQQLGIDPVQIPSDAAFNKRFRFLIEHDRDVDPQSAAHAVASMFGDQAARDAVIALDQAGLLPVSVRSYAIRKVNGSTGRGDLEVDAVNKIADGLVQLVQALPDVGADAPSNAPLIGAGGRKLIRRVKGESAFHKVLDVTDFWFIGAVVVGAVGGGAVGDLAPLVIDRHLEILPIAFVAIALPLFFFFIAVLRGFESAFFSSVHRSFGVGLLASAALFVGLHLFNVNAGHATSVSERDTLVATDRDGRHGSSTVRRANRQLLEVGYGYKQALGTGVDVTIKKGALGWRFLEK